MGVNNDNPCPICGSIYSEYAGAYLSTCRGCGNTFDAKAWTWEKTKPTKIETSKNFEQQARDMKEVLEWILDGSNVYRHSKVRTKIKEVLK